MSGLQLTIDVSTEAPAPRGGSAVIVVEPLYGVPAVALALDAGWGSVEVADLDPGGMPIPLVSFEQPPPSASAGGRCRVRCTDLRVAIERAQRGERLVLLGAPVIARPLSAQFASRTDLDVVSFLPAPAADTPMTFDGWWAAGMLIRVLLDEVEDRSVLLTDAAGIAVALARGAEDAAAQLSAGARWLEHMTSGDQHDLGVASAVDSVGVVPEVVLEGDDIIARPWNPSTV